MLGIPDDLTQSHRQSIIDGYYQRAADFRAKTGNPLPGTVKQDPNKKGARAETTEEIKARVAARRAENKAKKEAAAKDAQIIQAPTTAQNDSNGAGKEGDDFVALESAQADAIFPAEPVRHPCFITYVNFNHTNKLQFQQPNFNMPPYGYPPAYPPPNNNGAVFPGYPMHAFPPNPMPQAMPPQYIIPQQQTMPPQHFSPPPQITPPLPFHPPQQPKKSITPPAAVSGLPQRPSFDAPDLGKAEFATLHTQGSSQALAATNSSIPAKPQAVGEVDAAPYQVAIPYENLLDMQDGEELPLTNRRDGSRTTVSEAIKQVASTKSSGQLFWAKVEGDAGETFSFEELKAAAESVGVKIDETAEPAETTLAA